MFGRKAQEEQWRSEADLGHLLGKGRAAPRPGHAQGDTCCVVLGGPDFKGPRRRAGAVRLLLFFYFSQGLLPPVRACL